MAQAQKGKSLHNAKTLLTLIYGYLQILQGMDLTDKQMHKKIQELLEKSKKSSEKLANLLDKIE